MPVAIHSRAKAFLGPGAFAAVFECARLPSLGDLDVGSDLLGDGGDIQIAEAVIEGRAGIARERGCDYV